MLEKIRTHFPSSPTKWKSYMKVFFPVLLGAVLFTFNGFVDNFMVGQIEQGVASLGAANSWTNFLNGIFFGSAASGSMLLAQFYNAKEIERTKQVIRLRYLITISTTIIFIAIAHSFSQQLITTFLKLGKDASSDAIAAHKIAVDQAVLYLRINTIQWFLTAITFNLGSNLREIGHGKIAMYWGIATLSTNMSLNATFMYGMGMGVEGAAIASIASRVVELSIALIYLFRKKLEIKIKITSIFNISRETNKLYWKRWFNFFAVASVNGFITFRMFFYDLGYPVGKLGIGISGVGVLGLTGSIYNVFIQTFAVIGVMSAIFVAGELGKGDIKQAKINANELKGFSTTMSTFLAIMLVGFAFIVPSMQFLSKSQYDIDGNLVFDGVEQLRQVRNSLFVVAFYYPMWIWFSVSIRNVLAGGKGAFVNFIDWFLTGPFQLGVLSILAFIIIPSNSYIQENFWVAYLMFFSSDYFKLLFVELYYYKSEWAHSIVKEEIDHKGEYDEVSSDVLEIFDEINSKK